MKKTLIIISVFVISILIFSGCGGSNSTDSAGGDSTGGDSAGGDSTGGDSTGGDTVDITSDTIFYDAVQMVAPSFSPAGASSSLAMSKSESTVPADLDITRTWQSGNPLYDLFYILQEFDPATDQGVIDTSNLYKTMWEARNFLLNTRGSCNAITEQVITPPFDFGNSQTTYNCAYNGDSEDGYVFGGAMKELDASGNIISVGDEAGTETTAVAKYGLFGFVWPGDHNEYGTLQGVFNSSSNDLSLDIAVWVDYAGQSDYCYRNDIDGNSDTHAFTFRSIKGNREPDASYITIVGKGYSQGEERYFLLKITSDDLAGKYYCVGADYGETELRAMDVDGSDTVDANCAEYQEDVDAMTPLETTDLACASSDFNPGGTGTAAEGTVYLRFQ